MGFVGYGARFARNQSRPLARCFWKLPLVSKHNTERLAKVVGSGPQCLLTSSFPKRGFPRYLACHTNQMGVSKNQGAHPEQGTPNHRNSQVCETTNGYDPGGRFRVGAMRRWPCIDHNGPS